MKRTPAESPLPDSAWFQVPTTHWPWYRELFRWVFLAVVRCFYRVRVHGQERLPASGGTLLVSNHVSFLDGPLLMSINRRPVRMIVHAGNFRNRIWRKWGEIWGAIYIDAGPKATVRALRLARQAIERGYVVGIFAEGGITRTGQLQTFRPGLLRVLDGLDCPVCPVYLDGVWGSVFSFSGGRFFWKWPKRWRYPIEVHYGLPLRGLHSAAEIRQEVAEMAIAPAVQKGRSYLNLPRAFVRMCKRRLLRSKVADTSDSDLSGGNLLLRTLILRRLLLRQLNRDERRVGVLLPPSVGGVMANMALCLGHRVPVHLNYTATSAILNRCIEMAGLRHVVTSRRVMNKLDLKLDVPFIYLEDFKDKVTLWDKVSGAVGAFAIPSFVLGRMLGVGKLQGKSEATVVFTSGSTGEPKGVVLSYDNIACNVEAIEATVRLRSSDIVAGILPFFHSFGYTVTLWTPMALDLKAVYHFSPLDARRVGAMIEQHRATLLLATPTFLRAYVKRCTPEQLKSLDVVVVGAERLPSALSDAFEARFGIRPIEGYGCTELSPLVSLNIPPSRTTGSFQVNRKEGSVGRTIPGVAARIVDRETGQPLRIGEEGMLQIAGPNVMQGYLHRKELTDKVVRNGWYETGDIARIDEDGFIFITGRESRFSKIGGEMVPHGVIEDALQKLVAGDDDAAPQLAVTAVPDERKGERLVVLHVGLSQSPESLCEGLMSMDLPPLYIPSQDSFFKVAAIPLLGTGKLDLHRLKTLAMESVGGSGEGR